MVNESEGYLSCVVNRSFYSALVLHSVMNGYVVSPRKSYTPYILQFYTESLSGEIKQPSHPTALRRYFFHPCEYCAWELETWSKIRKTPGSYGSINRRLW